MKTVNLKENHRFLQRVDEQNQELLEEELYNSLECYVCGEFFYSQYLIRYIIITYYEEFKISPLDSFRKYFIGAKNILDVYAAFVQYIVLPLDISKTAKMPKEELIQFKEDKKEYHKLLLQTTNLYVGSDKRYIKRKYHRRAA